MRIALPTTFPANFPFYHRTENLVEYSITFRWNLALPDPVPLSGTDMPKSSRKKLKSSKLSEHSFKVHSFEQLCEILAASKEEQALRRRGYFIKISSNETDICKLVNEWTKLYLWNTTLPLDEPWKCFDDRFSWCGSHTWLKKGVKWLFYRLVSERVLISTTNIGHFAHKRRRQCYMQPGTSPNPHCRTVSLAKPWVCLIATFPGSRYSEAYQRHAHCLFPSAVDKKGSRELVGETSRCFQKSKPT